LQYVSRIFGVLPRKPQLLRSMTFGVGEIHSVDEKAELAASCITRCIRRRQAQFALEVDLDGMECLLLRLQKPGPKPHCLSLALRDDIWLARERRAQQLLAEMVVRAASRPASPSSRPQSPALQQMRLMQQQQQGQVLSMELRQQLQLQLPGARSGSGPTTQILALDQSDHSAAAGQEHQLQPYDGGAASQQVVHFGGELDEVFARYDTNASGYMDAAELGDLVSEGAAAALPEAGRPAERHRWRSVPCDLTSASLCLQQCRSMGCSYEEGGSELADLLYFLDADNDGWISKDEFAKWWNSSSS
jgi:hypothetical protein